jgi:hypothetical protein
MNQFKLISYYFITFHKALGIWGECREESGGEKEILVVEFQEE